MELAASPGLAPLRSPLLLWRECPGSALLQLIFSTERAQAWEERREVGWGAGPNSRGGTEDHILLQSPAWCEVLRSICDENKVVSKHLPGAKTTALWHKRRFNLNFSQSIDINESPGKSA